MFTYVRQFLKALSDDSIDSRSSSISYAFMLSIFPFLIGVFALLQLLEQSSKVVFRVLDTFNEFFPPDIHEFILEHFRDISYERTGSILVISLVASIGFGSYGFKTIFKHLSRIFRDKKPRSFIWMSVFSIIFSAGAVVVIVTSFILLMLSNNFVTRIATKFDIASALPLLVNIVRYPLVFFGLVVFSSIVYRIGPRRKIPLKCVLTSSVLFSGGWVFATYMFGVYLSRSTKYNLIYGALAGVIVFLVWMYLSAFIFLSAAEIGKIRMEKMRKLRDQSGSAVPGKISTASDDRPPEGTGDNNGQ